MRLTKSPLFELVYELTAQVPKGRVTTYAALAYAINRPRAARFVGNVLAVCPHPNSQVPCHRVIKSNGEIGGFGIRGREKKARLLAKEGVEMKDGRVDLRHYLFDEFELPHTRSLMTGNA